MSVVAGYSLFTAFSTHLRTMKNGEAAYLVNNSNSLMDIKTVRQFEKDNETPSNDVMI